MYLKGIGDIIVKYFVSIIVMISLCLQPLLAQSQIGAEVSAQTIKESDEWAQKIDNLIKLYAAESPRDYITVEEVKDYSLEELLKISLGLAETSSHGESEAIFRYYQSKATKADNVQHIKLAQIFLLEQNISYGKKNDTLLRLQKYTEDEDLFVAFMAHNIRLRHAAVYLGASISIYSSYMDSYAQIRTLMPSPNHTLYKHYRYLDANNSAVIMTVGSNISASYHAHQEAYYFARELEIPQSYYTIAHNLIYLHSQIYSDKNSEDLAQKLFAAAQLDKGRKAFASYLLLELLIQQEKFIEAKNYVNIMGNMGEKRTVIRVAHSLSSIINLYTGNLDEAKASINSFHQITKSSEEEIKNSHFTKQLDLLIQLKPEQRPQAIAVLIDNNRRLRFVHDNTWKQLTKSYIHSLGAPSENGNYSFKNEKIPSLSKTIKEKLAQTIQLVKAPNILTDNNNIKSPNAFSLILKHAENEPSTATHYLQNSEFYKTLVSYDYSKDLVFQQSKYINLDPPKLLAGSPERRFEILQIDILKALHYVYTDDTQAAWQLVAEISAEIMKPEANFALLDYQLEYIKFLLLTKEQNLYLAIQAANNHVTKAIDLTRPVNEVSILENLIYLLYESSHYEQALALVDEVPRSSESGTSLSESTEFMKAKLLTQSGQHTAALSLAQIHDSEKYSDESEALFQSFKYLSQAAMGDIENAKITKQVLSNRLSHISNTNIQNVAHLNMARAQVLLEPDNIDDFKDNAQTLARTLENNKHIKLTKLRAHRDQANLKKHVHIASNLNNLIGMMEDNRSSKRTLYLVSAFFALIAMLLGLNYFKKTRFLNNRIMSLRQKIEETQNVYDYLSLASKERVGSMRRNLKTIKNSHIDEATISSLSVAINEADSLLEDIKRSKVRSRLASSLDDTVFLIFDPHKFRSSMTPIWMQRIKSKNVTLTFDCDPKLKPFETDVEILIAAIEDTVTKAINATLFGSIVVGFNVTKKLKSHLLSINITDTGDASQSYSTDDIATQAIAALNGSLNHSCEPGVGCTVKMTLPIKIAKPRIKPAQNSNVVTFKV